MSEIAQLVGAGEIRQMLGVSSKRLAQLTRTASFPKPCAVLAAGWIWWAADIEEWIANRRGRRAPVADPEAIQQAVARAAARRKLGRRTLTSLKPS